MNKREQLITDALGDNGGHGFARAAAAQVRRRRAIKRTSLTAGLTAAAILAGIFARQPHPSPPALESIRVSAPVLEIMSDQELLVQLKDKSVLILKNKTGITDVVFLAKPNDSSTGNSRPCKG